MAPKARKPPVTFNEDDITSFTNFDDENRLGTENSSFGHVYKGYIPENNRCDLPEQPVAIKRSSKLTLEEQFKAEIEWLTKLEHPNIICLIGHCQTNTYYYLVYELAEMGSVEKHLMELSWEQTLKILKGVVAAVNYMHSYPGHVVHGDIKPGNILLAADYEPKLGDFGFTRIEGKEGFEGVEGYFIPSQTDKKAKRENDIYALGTTTLQLLMQRNHMVYNLRYGFEHIKYFGEKNDFQVSPRLKSSGCNTKHGEKLKKLALKSLPDKYKADYEFATSAEWSLLVHSLNIDTLDKFKVAAFDKCKAFIKTITKHEHN